MRFFPTACLFHLIAMAHLATAADSPSSGSPPLSASGHRLPKEFTAVDTSRLMGSPDPLPLEAVRVFEKLKFERPVELTFAPDDTNRLFVAEQGGTIRVFENKNDVAEAKVFLDITDVTLREGNEEGLLGLAFHPDYAKNGKFYVYYSTREPKDDKTSRASVVAEFTVSDDPAKADRDSERRLMFIPQPFENHNGGSMQFGPDGFLYIGLGDGGKRDDPFENAQNLTTVLGKILRIDVDGRDGDLPYAIPHDNPFVDHKEFAENKSARGEIWAYGFRNPWRLGFDRKSGELWMADVGQDRFEEVNRVERGGNYGWNIREAAHDFQPATPAKDQHLIEPLAEYFRGEGQSVTGGFVYRHKRLPNYEGRYFYGDYLSGNVWTVQLNDAKQVMEKRQVAHTGLQIAAFGRDADDDMYLCAFDGGIYQLRERDADLDAQRRAFPRKLSETGLFASVENNEPAAGLIPYELNVPFWSDYASKDRYLALPKDRSVQFKEDEAWGFPVGAVLVKTFWMHHDRAAMADARRLETRLLVNSPEGWVGYTYVYDHDGKEATLLDGSATKSLEIKTVDGDIHQSYYFPSRVDCMTCHTKQHGFVLGLETAQLNRDLRYHGEAENQLALFKRLNLFTEPMTKKPADFDAFPDWGFGNFDRSGAVKTAHAYELPQGDTATLARVWLDVNCSMCHLPDGIAPMKRDLRFDTPLAKMNVVDQPIGQLRRLPADARLIRSGDPLRSDLLWRVGHRGTQQMPPLATNYVDPQGYEILRRWIAELKPPETTSKAKAADDAAKTENDVSEVRPLFDEETGPLLLHERPSQHRSLSSTGRLFR